MIKWFTIPEVSDKTLDDPNFVPWFNDTVRQAETRNSEIARELSDHYETLLKEVIFVFGENSNEYKYMVRAKVQTGFSLEKKVKAVWKRYNDRIEAKKQAIINAERKRQRELKAEERRLAREEEQRLAAIAEEQRLEAQREERRLYRERQEEAVYVLTEKGYIPGQDFEKTNAISFLKSINDKKKAADEEAELERLARLNQFEVEATSYEA